MVCFIFIIRNTKQEILQAIYEAIRFIEINNTVELFFTDEGAEFMYVVSKLDGFAAEWKSVIKAKDWSDLEILKLGTIINSKVIAISMISM